MAPETISHATLEDELVTDPGIRTQVPLARAENWLRGRGEPPDAIQQLVNERLLRLEESDVPHVQLAHDVLVPVAIKRRDARAATAKARALLRRGLTAAAGLVVLLAAGWGMHSCRQADERAKEAMQQAGDMERQNRDLARRNALRHRRYAIDLSANGPEEATLVAAHLAGALEADPASRADLEPLVFQFLARGGAILVQLLAARGVRPRAPEVRAPASAPHHSGRPSRTPLPVRRIQPASIGSRAVEESGSRNAPKIA